MPIDAAYDEGAHLNFADITVDSIKKPRVLKVRMKVSKTDPFRVGVDVFVGKTDNSFNCSVSAVLQYTVHWGESTGPFFKSARWSTTHPDKACCESQRSSNKGQHRPFETLGPQLQGAGLQLRQLSKLGFGDATSKYARSHIFTAACKRLLMLQ